MRDLCVFVGVVLVVGARGAAHAGPVNSYDRGWYSSSGIHSVGIDSLVTGNDDLWREFFAFALPDAPAGQEVISASLVTYFAGVADAHTVTLHEFSGSIASLTAGTAGVAGFNDLGSGTEFGSHHFVGTERETLVAYTLDANAIAAMNASLGGNFAIGGRSNSTSDSSYTYDGSLSYNPVVRKTYLDLTFADSTLVPLPSGAAMAMIGMGVIGVRRRRS